jgi:hypothetical protein
VYEATVNYRKLREELGFPVAHLPELFEKTFGEPINKQTCYAWFSRGCLSAERLAQILTIVRLESGRRLDLWQFIEVPRNPEARRRFKKLAN